MERTLWGSVWPQPNARQLNILRSPKKGGSSETDALPYLEQLGVRIFENRQPIQFTSNVNEHIHRWAPYVQGFSASFVQSVFDLHAKEYGDPKVVDPFSGCGTVPVQAKLNGYRSFGVELNPLLRFIAHTKVSCWDVSPAYFLKMYREMRRDRPSPAPPFLRSHRHFNDGVLRNLEILRGGIESIEANNGKQRKAKDLIRLAFSSVLVESSNLKRSPCLGYARRKRVYASAPFVLLDHKTNQIADDLRLIQSEFGRFIDTESQVAQANSIHFKFTEPFDLVITSPPYMNGLDYVINYKIEMGWLGFANSQRDLRTMKDEMVVCDNVSKGLVKEFRQSRPAYTNEWIEDIKAKVQEGIERRGDYRRKDMPHIVHKYFDDMYRVMSNVVPSLNLGGRFILVVGDSLVADVYIPTDLLIARIGLDLGLGIERIEKARDRRSGQIRSYKLRESIVTLVKR